MTPSHKSTFHIRRLNIFLTIGIVLACLFSSVRSTIISTTVQFDHGVPQKVELPFQFKVFPSKTYETRLEVQRSAYSPVVYAVKADNCVDAVHVNGTRVEEFRGYCDHLRAKRINLRGYLTEGVNTISLRVRDTGWFTGLNMRTSVIDPTNLVFLLLLLMLLRWYAHPYITPQSPYAIETIFHRLPHKKRRRISMIVGTCIAAGLTYALYIAMVKLGIRVAYELSGSYTVDTPMYWAVGRGIVNGLTPYVDLFETKPPGIFMISAISLWLTDSFAIGHMLQGICILGIPFLIASIAAHEARKLSAKTQMFYAAGGMLLGTLITLYIAERSGEYQVESFGAFFGTLYVWSLATSRLQFNRTQFCIATIGMLTAIGVKEPFLLPLTAASILLNTTIKQTVERFIKPLIAAACIGLAVMIYMGFLVPYFTVYLDEMLGRHIHMHDSLTNRSLDFQRLISDISMFSSYLYYALFASVMAALLQHRKKICYATVVLWIARIFAVLFLLGMSVGMGGQYWNHHFAFAVPGYVAIAVLAIRTIRLHWYRRTAKCLFATIILCSILGVSSFHQPDYKGHLLNVLKPDLEMAQKTAIGIDAILDACGKDTYMFLGHIRVQPYAFTRHSPMGPNFFQIDYFTSEDRAFFRETYLENLQTAPLIVKHEIVTPHLRRETEDTLHHAMQREPWDCAAPFMHLIDNRYTVYFRT